MCKKNRAKEYYKKHKIIFYRILFYKHINV